MTRHGKASASSPQGPAGGITAFSNGKTYQGMSNPLLAAKTRAKVNLDIDPVLPGLAAFLAEHSSRAAAELLGVTIKRVQQLRRGYRPHLARAQLRRLEYHLARQHPFQGRWVERRVRNGTVLFKGLPYPVPAAWTQPGQRLLVAPTHNGQLLMRPAAVTADCVAVHTTPPH